jgi:hypothetical protein
VLHRLPEASPALRALIEKQAEGNPFYAEELVKMLIDDGVILVEGERWRVLDERLSVARIPGTLTGVLQARLDALSAAERRAVQLASVIGPVFWDDALHSLDPKRAVDAARARAEGDGAGADGSAFAGTREAGVPAPPPAPGDLRHGAQVRSSRGACPHRRVAGGAGRRPRGRIPGGHGRALRARRRRVRALDWYERAAARRRRAYANEAAWTYLQRMLAMPELGDSRRRWKAAGTQVAVADLIADRVRHRAAVDEEARIAERSTTTRCALGGDVPGAARRSPGRPRRSGQSRAAGRRAGRASNAAAAGALRPCRAVVAGTRARRYRAGASPHGARLPLATQAAQQMKWPNDDIYESLLRLVAGSLHSAESTSIATAARRGSALRSPSTGPAPPALLEPRVARALGADVLDTERAARHLEDAEAVAREIGQTLIIATLPCCARGWR